ncbi:MAG: sigma-54-dependent transcriptional regulator [Candidatus Hodarchaeales archaeon]
MKKSNEGYLTKYLRSDFFLYDISKLMKQLSEGGEYKSKEFKKTLYEIVEKVEGLKESKDIYLPILAMLYHDIKDIKGIAGGQPTTIDTSESLQKFCKKLYLKSKSKKVVLIIGESGTSKELIAKAIHYLGDRSNKDFIEINCAAIPENLLETELFGYEKGAFTGAYKSKIGLIEKANKSTFFLDEIGKMPEPQQGKLLKVIEEKKFYRVGGHKSIDIDVKFIAAAQNEKDIIPDLRARLGSNIIKMLPLRERLKINSDIPKLLLPKVIEDMGDIVGQDYFISKGANEKLLSYSYKNNYRDLESTLEAAIESAYEEGRKEILVTDIPNEDIDNVEKQVSTVQIEEPLDFRNIKLKDIISYGDKIRSDIVKAKIRAVLKEGQDLKAVLINEGLPEYQYDGMLKKLRKVSKSSVKELTQ